MRTLRGSTSVVVAVEREAEAEMRLAEAEVMQSNSEPIQAAAVPELKHLKHGNQHH